jgi:uncharacterized protein (DUF1778 family)
MLLAHKDDQEDDATTGVKTARMEQRTTEKAKQLIEQAAELCGINASEFTTQAAVKAARDTLKEYQGTVLTPKDHAAFMRAFEATEPTEDLKTLMSQDGIGT